ncbi:MAG TPA: Crp/Fnr family transcriptional regulator, partial [Acetobacteraceae bacterium]|nr:Crp/Fnr family transcriptional regulator [Acetobacteraceae bacterium]
ELPVIGPAGRRSLDEPFDSNGSGMAARVRALASVPLLAPLSPSQLAAFAQLARERTAARGEWLFHRGDPGDFLLVVLAGELRVSVSGADGREQILRALGPGDVVGEIAVLDGRPRSADALAVTRARLLVVDRRAVLEEIARNTEFGLALMRLLCKRLRATSAALEAMLFHDSGTRLAAALVQLSGGREGARVDLTQNQLGEMVGAARETVNKKLRIWEKEGLVALSPGRVIVKAPLRLTALLPDQGVIGDS